MTSTASYNISGQLFGNFNLGPLITTFTPPATCLSHLYLDGSSRPPQSSSYRGLVPTVTFPTLGWPTQTECYPPGYQAASSAFRTSQRGTLVTFGGYFSPAVCPAGYTMDCTADIVFTSAGEQIALCCPSGYRCWALKGSCISELTNDNTVTFVTAPSGEASEQGLPRSYISWLGDSTTTYINSALAAPIQVRWASSDSIDLTTTLRPPLSPTTQPSVVLPSVVQSTTQQPQTPNAFIPPQHRLGKIGPEVYMSVAIPSALIVVGCLFYFLRIRRARKNAAADLSRLDEGIVEKAELGGECIMPQESGGIMRLELDAIEAIGGPGMTVELQAPIAELAAPVPELEGSGATSALEVDYRIPTETALPISANIIADEAGELPRVDM